MIWSVVLIPAHNSVFLNKGHYLPLKGLHFLIRMVDNCMHTTYTYVAKFGRALAQSTARFGEPRPPNYAAL